MEIVAPALSLGRLPVPSRSKFRAVRGFVAFLIRRVSERPFLNRGCGMGINALSPEDRRSWHLNAAAIAHACADWPTAKHIVTRNEPR